MNENQTLTGKKRIPLSFFVWIAIIFLSLLSCSSSRMVETSLYFGQTIPNGPMITEAEWQNFKDTHIARVFTQGSTTTKVTGTWYDPNTKILITEPSYVVTNFHKRSRLYSMQVDSLRELYKTMFRQQSVLRVDKKVQLVSF